MTDIGAQAGGRRAKNGHETLAASPGMTLAESLRLKLEGAIAAGHLEPGSRLDEQESAQRCGVSRNGFIIALATLALARINGRNDVMTLFAFHNRVDVRTQHAAGFLASLLPLGVKLDEVDTLADLYDVINTESTNSIAHSTYDWVTLRDNPFLSDSIAVVYETADITDMSALDALDAVMEPLSAKSQAALRRNMLQTLEMGDSIITTLVYMATIYSDELIDRFDKCYADLAKTLIAVEDPKSVKIADLLA